MSMNTNKRVFAITAGLLATALGICWYNDVISADPDQQAAVAPRPAVVPREQIARVQPMQDEDSGSSEQPGHLRMGGPGLNLQEVLKDGLAARGTDDELLAGFASIAVGLCNNPYPSDHAGRKDPNRKWAIEYLTAACADLDVGTFRYTGSSKDALWYWTNVGDEEAAAAALEDMHRTDNMAKVGLASYYLIAKDLFPGQSTYDVTKEELQKIGLMAGKLRTCAAMEACGSDSLITAELCARVGCRPGTTYIQAVRRDLSPRELDILKRVQDTMSES
jgi:hypothetical protein